MRRPRPACFRTKTHILIPKCHLLHHRILHRRLHCLLLVSGVAADGLGRVLEGRLRGATRTAELTVTNAKSEDRLQGRLQQDTRSGVKLEWADGMLAAEAQATRRPTAGGGFEELNGLTALKVSSGVIDVFGLVDSTVECKHDFGTKKTGFDVVTTSAGGTMLALACDLTGGVEEVSAFHRAGPVNLQPRWLTKSKLLRLHVGRGGAFRRCPVSMQVDVPLSDDSETPLPDFEFKVRRPLGRGRMLRAVWLATQGAVLMEMEDTATEKDAAWVARVRAPYLENGRQHLKPELTLKRKWQW